MGKLSEYIVSDHCRYYGAAGNTLFKSIIHAIMPGGYRGFKYGFWLRVSQYRGLFQPLGIIMHHHLSIKYCIDMPRITRIGYGLYLGHGMCMVVNGRTVIGNNVNLSQFLNIGANSVDEFATIGDNVYVAPHCSIVGRVSLGDNVTIGTGSVVTRDIASGMTAVGAPAHEVTSENPGRYINNRYEPKG